MCASLSCSSRASADNLQAVAPSKCVGCNYARGAGIWGASMRCTTPVTSPVPVSKLTSPRLPPPSCVSEAIASTHPARSFSSASASFHAYPPRPPPSPCLKAHLSSSASAFLRACSSRFSSPEIQRCTSRACCSLSPSSLSTSLRSCSASACRSWEHEPTHIHSIRCSKNHVLAFP